MLQKPTRSGTELRRARYPRQLTLQRLQRRSGTGELPVCQVAVMPNTYRRGRSQGIDRCCRVRDHLNRDGIGGGSIRYRNAKRRVTRSLPRAAIASSTSFADVPCDARREFGKRCAGVEPSKESAQMGHRVQGRIMLLSARPVERWTAKRPAADRHRAAARLKAEAGKAN